MVTHLLLLIFPCAPVGFPDLSILWDFFCFFFFLEKKERKLFLWYFS